MKFGYFDDQAREYVITTPITPQPWINYLGKDNFFSLISNTCGGYSFYKDAKLLRLTRYRYNNIPRDTNGRYYFIKQGDTDKNPVGLLRMPPRPGLQPLYLGQRKYPGRFNRLCPLT